VPNIVVYTAISQGYDRLNAPPGLWRSETAFVAFLEKPPTTAGWEFRPIYRRFRDPCRNAKIHKILPHKYFPDAEYSLWVDGSVKIKSTLPLARWIEEYLSHHDLAVFQHRVRNCCYMEAKACIDKRRDSFAVINRQMQRYFEDGYPRNNGLAECTVLFRRHTKRIEQFNEKWYAEIRAFSRRDQLSFNYVAHKLGVKYELLPGNLSDNPHFDWLPHQAKSNVAATTA
jgi:hypothetical protein